MKASWGFTIRFMAFDVGVRTARARLRLVAFSVLSLAALSSSCVNVTNVLETNGGGSSRGSGRSTVNAGTPQVTIGTSGNAAFKLLSVLQSSSDPSSSFDLIGEGDTFGTFCTSSGGGAGNPNSASTCLCVYDYITTAGSAEQVRVDTTYHEQNLLRCPYASQLPSNIASVSVRVYLSNADLFSNSVSVRLGTNTTTSSPTDPSAFVQPRRYQCKNTVTINYDFDGNLYDPIRSEDPKMSRVMNFYSSDIGGTWTQWLSGDSGVNHKFWDCPSIPNDPAAGMDLTVYSRNSDGSSEKIFPAKGSRFDRSTFFLAKKPTGVFNLRVNARVAPDFYSCAGSKGGAGCATEALGYGATPVVTSTGEACPTTAEIPAGFRWVKIWRFKAENLDARRIQNNPTAIAQIGAIACNPGKWKLDDATQLPARGGTTIYSIFPDCGANGGVALSTTDVISDRVFGNDSGLRCVSLSSGAAGSQHAFCASNGGRGAGCSTDPNTGQQKAVTPLELYSKGTDVWTWPRGFQATLDFNPEMACSTAGISDPLGFCTQAPLAGTGAIGRVPAFVADRTQVLDGGNSQDDDLIVVSPPELTAKEVRELQSAALPYVPFRFYSSSACTSESPSSAPPGDCLERDRINYAPVEHDITQESDGGSGRQVLFPVCALQPTT